MKIRNLRHLPKLVGNEQKVCVHLRATSLFPPGTREICMCGRLPPGRYLVWWVKVRACMRACMRACVRASVCAYVSVWACLLAW